MRMLWWFVILGISMGLALGAAIAMYLRVRRHMRASDEALRGTLHEIESASMSARK